MAICDAKQLAKDPNQSNLDKLLENRDFVKLYQKYTEFKEDVRQCHLGKTAQFWIDYKTNYGSF